MKCNPERSAFTLLESLITVFLVMLVFGLVADMLLGAFRVTRFERQKVEAAEAGQLALNRILCEVREACKVVTPITPPDELTFYKFNATRTLVAGADLNRFEHVLRIRYYKDARGTLLRDVEEPPAATETHVVADNIQGLGFSLDPNTRNLLVSLSVDVKGRLRVISSEVAPLAVLP